MLNSYLTIVATTVLIGMYQTPQTDTFFEKHGMHTNITSIFPYGQQVQNKIEALKISGIATVYSTKELSTDQVNLITQQKDQHSIKPQDARRLQIQADDEQNGNHIGSVTSQFATLKPEDFGDTTEEELYRRLQMHADEEQNGKYINEDTNTKCTKNCIVLMLGDSVMGDVAMSMKRKIKKLNPDWKVIDAHKVSTGLTNARYYNWPEIAKELADAKKPDYTYVLMGMNDAQPMSMENHGYAFGKESWTIEYSKRVEAIIDILKKGNTSGWAWIQLPSVANPKFNTKLDVIRNIQQTKVPTSNYLEIDSIVGSYVSSKDESIKTRANDGVHLNVKGSDLIAEKICNQFNIAE